MHRLTWLALLCVAIGAASAAEVEVIALKYRSAEQLIPVIRPLLAPGGTVTGMHNQLILRTSKSNLDDIQKVLTSLDAMPRRLMIYVRQSAAGLTVQSGASVSTEMSPSETGTATLRQRELSARVYETRGATDEGITQRIQVLEGNVATIHLGQSVPVPAQSVTRTVNGIVYANDVVYRDFSTGFQVVPRITGDRVILDISQRRDTPTGHLGGASMERAATVASGRLGVWFELGASAQKEARSDAGVLIGAAGQRKDQRNIWVKVEEMK